MTPVLKNPHLHLSWTTFQRRQLSMREYFGFECVFLGLPAGGIIRKLFQYFVLFWRSLSLMLKNRAQIVWVQLPQVPLLWAALVYKRLKRGKPVIIADCHNSLFRPPWASFPLGLSLLKNCDHVLVHNSTVLEAASSAKIPHEKLSVLEDVPPKIKGVQAHSKYLGSRPLIVFPATFGRDEPIGELFAVAGMAPEWTFVVTGDARRSKAPLSIQTLPANVVLSGYLSTEEFEALLADSDIILGLTRLEGVQLSVCNEALGFGKAMVLSDTKILRELFSGASVFVDSADPRAIVAGLAEALKNKSFLENGSRELCARRFQSWEAGQALTLKQILVRKIRD